MRLKLDENLPAELATLLQQNGHDVDTVTTEDLLCWPLVGMCKCY
jgi:predicted nuclease of predicted toxin-antitoxin system